MRQKRKQLQFSVAGAKGKKAFYINGTDQRHTGMYEVINWERTFIKYYEEFVQLRA
jgi:hypothetical protein